MLNTITLRNKRGFTLLEILVSMVVTVIVVGLLTYVARTAFASLSDGSNDISSYQKAQTVMERIALDLETMVYRNGTDQWLAAEAIKTNDTSGSYATTFGAEARNKDAVGYSSRFTFFSSVLDRYDGDLTQPGDISCLEYGVVFADPIEPSANNTPNFVLYRQVINPDYTFQNLIGSNDLLGDVESGRGSAATNAPISLDNSRNLLCTNIKAFSITFHVEHTVTTNNGGTTTNITKIPILEVGDASTDQNKADSIEINGNGIVVSGGAGLNGITSPKIVAIDINLQVINDDGVILNNAGVDAQRTEQEVVHYSKTVYPPFFR